MDPKDIVTIDISNLPAETVTISTIDWDSLTVSSGNANDFITIDAGDLNLDWIIDYDKQQEWVKINKAAKDHPALQKAIERVKILYYLSKEDGNSETGH